MIIAMAGLPGTGKTTIALALSEAIDGVVLNKDVVRAALFPPDEIRYSRHQDDFVFDVMLQAAAYMGRTGRDRPIILDGRTFSQRAQIDVLTDFCRRHCYPLAVIHCVCSDETARARIGSDRTANNHLAANRDFDLYLRTRAAADPLDLPHLTLDTEQPVSACIQQCRAYLESEEINHDE